VRRDRRHHRRLTRDAIRRGKLVARHGCAALQVTPVHYLFKPDEQAMVDHFRRMADETGMPIIIYNVCRGPISRRAADTDHERGAAGHWREAERRRPQLFADLMMMAPDKLI